MCVEEISPESDHCPLTLTLDLQAQNPWDSELTSQVQSTGSDASLLQIKYNVDEVEIFREALSNLLEPVFGIADPSCCLATALLSCISHAALATFGRASKHKCQKADQKWYDAECKAARAALNHVPHGTSQHSAL